MEMKILFKRWEDTVKKVHEAKDTPKLVYEETSRTVALLRDLFNPSYENIYVMIRRYIMKFLIMSH